MADWEEVVGALEAEARESKQLAEIATKLKAALEKEHLRLPAIFGDLYADSSSENFADCGRFLKLRWSTKHFAEVSVGYVSGPAELKEIVGEGDPTDEKIVVSIVAWAHTFALEE